MKMSKQMQMEEETFLVKIKIRIIIRFGLKQLVKMAGKRGCRQVTSILPLVYAFSYWFVNNHKTFRLPLEIPSQNETVTSRTRNSKVNVNW